MMLLVIYMFKKFIEEYTNELKEKENKSTYNKASLISLIFSLTFILIWTILIILTYALKAELAQIVLIIISFVFSYIINPIILLVSVFFLILQWKLTFNKYTILSLIGCMLLFSTTIISIF